MHEGGDALIAAYRALTKHIDKALAPHALSIPRLKLLTFVDAAGPSRMSTVAAGLDIAVRSAMDAVASLERDGMLTRSADPHDRRAVLADLTPAGRKALAEALTVGESAMSASFAALTPEETAILVTLLKKLRTTITDA
jgi:DNA-binding MarR family transcriptional regulator